MRGLRQGRQAESRPRAEPGPCAEPGPGAVSGRRRTRPARRRVVAEDRGGELVQDGRVDVPGHDRHDHRVTIAARRRRGTTRRPRRLRADGAVQAAELIQGHVQLDQCGLPGAVGHAPGGDQLPARFFQAVMVTLAHGAGVFRAGFLAERVQHRVQRSGALRGQVTFHPARVIQGPVQPQPPIREPTIIGVGLGAAAPHLLRQPGQIRQLRAARRSRQQNLIGVRLLTFGEFAGPGADLPRPRRRDLPRRQRLADRRMRGQPPCPADRPGGRAAGDPGLPPKPRSCRALPVVLAAAGGDERG